MLAVQFGILMVLGQPCIVIGTAALVAGAAAGVTKNLAESGSLEFLTAAAAAAARAIRNRFQPRSRLLAGCPVLVPVMLLVPEQKMAGIDALLKDRNVARARRLWIMAAIDEKLERESTPGFPAAA